MQDISSIIAHEIGVSPSQINAAINLVDEGNTIPFIARYRKEVTGGLDDTQLRHFETRLLYLRELDDRKQTILKSIESQGKLSDELRLQITQTQTKTALEDLYLPFKPKRRTKGQIALEAGLGELADFLWNETDYNLEQSCTKYLNLEAGFDDVKKVSDGARNILIEKIAEDASLIAKLRHFSENNALIFANKSGDEIALDSKFKDYFTYSEAVKTIPSHRILAILRGRNEKELQLGINFNPNELTPEPTLEIIADHLDFNLNPNINRNTKDAFSFKLQVINWAWKIKLSLYLETEIIANLRSRAEVEAIDVFATNLKALLMSAPAGAKNTMGIDPGIRTGIKVVVIDNTGKFISDKTLYPFTKSMQAAKQELLNLGLKHKVEIIAIGNGTASRESERMVAEILAENPNWHATKVVVSEAGASVYSASELAAKEFPDLDVSLRGAISIARRLQDPLAELVKIDPKSIGAGQYQHDVNQLDLSKKLTNVVEDCVNNVGVDLNTASAKLVSYVAGISETLAQNIIEYRNQNGRFNSRAELKKVPRLGEKAFEQCAGFLRIRDGKNLLDSSAVHPEAYDLVKQIASQAKLKLEDLVQNSALLKQLNPKDFVGEKFGLPTILDIFSELEKPGRDPRGEFKTAEFKEGVEEISDLMIGMKLEGVVTNVTNFGAFVDIGVHQDGLVHISMLSDKFVANPHDVVKTGDIVKVEVIDLEVKRKRISLSMKTQNDIAKSPKKADVNSHKEVKAKNNNAVNNNNFNNNAFSNNPFAQALSKMTKK